MPEIELDCPSCQEHLTLDEAFADGVCRCSNCGTVMSVPSQARSQSTRPGAPMLRPDLPAGVKSHGRKKRRQLVDEITVEAEQEAIEAQSERLNPAAMDTDEIALEEFEHDLDDRESSAHHAMLVTAKEDGSFVTPSGRKISVSSPALIPTAPSVQEEQEPRRRSMMITFVGMLIMTASTILILGITYFSMMLLNEQANQAADPASPTATAPTSNPFSSDQPNFFHLPLKNQTALVVDGYGLSSAWNSQMKKSMVAASKTFGPNAVQFFFFTDVDKPHVYPAEAGVLGPIQRQELGNLIETELYTINVSDPMAALAKALESRPKQLILMTGQKLSREKIRAIGNLIGGARLRFDVILVDVSDIQWTRLTATYGGQSLTVTESQVVQWLNPPAPAGATKKP
jgi:hypothetical protein